MSDKETNAQAQGLEEENKALKEANEQLEKSNDELSEKVVSLTEANEALKVDAKKAEEKAEKTDTGGYPAVVMYKGKKYTYDEYKGNKKIMDSLKKSGFVKSKKK